MCKSRSCPGSIGDFKLPVENLNLQKYTIVVWEAPGCGKSRPPDRDVSPGLFHRDADHAIALMEVGTSIRNHRYFCFVAFFDDFRFEVFYYYN